MKSPYINPLARMQPSRPDTEQIKRTGWRNQGILVVSENDERLDFIDKEFVRQLGKKLYGERQKERQ